MPNVLELAAFGVLFAAIVTGCASNAFVVHHMKCRRQLHKLSIAYLLMGMSLNDIFDNISRIPYLVQMLTAWLDWPIDRRICPLFGLGTYFGSFTTKLILILMTVDRILALTHPLYHRNRNHKQFFTRSIISIQLLASIPALSVAFTIAKPEKDAPKYILCFDEKYETSPYIMFVYLAVFLLDFATYVVGFVLYFKLRKYLAKTTAESRTKAHERSQANIALYTILVHFGFATIPIIVNSALGFAHKYNLLTMTQFYSVTFMMVAVNLLESTVNAFIVYMRLPGFRRSTAKVSTIGHSTQPHRHHKFTGGKY